MATRRVADESEIVRRPPATTDDAHERRLISMAYEVAEEQLRDRTMSSQVLSTLIKAGSGREQLERDKIRNENDLLKARVEQLESSARMEELYEGAIVAMKEYQGGSNEIPDDA